VPIEHDRPPLLARLVDKERDLSVPRRREMHRVAGLRELQRPGDRLHRSGEPIIRVVARLRVDVQIPARGRGWAGAEEQEGGEQKSAKHANGGWG